MQKERKIMCLVWQKISRTNIQFELYKMWLVTQISTTLFRSFQFERNDSGAHRYIVDVSHEGIRPIPIDSVKLDCCDQWECNQVVCKNIVLKVTMQRTLGSSLLHYVHVAYNLKFVCTTIPFIFGSPPLNNISKMLWNPVYFI